MRLTRLKNISLVTMLFFCISYFSFGQNKMEIPPQMTIGKLSNGLSYYILPKGDKGKVRLTLISNTGALAETPEQHGYAHILEHMAFNGSKNFPGKASSDALEDMGMRQGKEYTAATSTINTQYDLYIPENNLEYMRKTFLLFKDWIHDLELNEKSLEMEKKVIIEEMNLGGGGSTASPFLIGTKMDNHDVLGDKESINSATAENLRTFYEKHYTPDQLAVIVFGTIDKNKAKQMIEEIFSKIPASTSKITTKYPDLTQETIVDGGYTYRDLSKETSLTIASKRASFVIDNYENLKLSYINRIFSEMLEKRLEQLSNGTISQSNVNITTLMPGNQITNVRLRNPRGTSYKQMFDTFCSVLAQINQYGFLENEINYYSNNILTRIEKQKNTTTLSYSAAEKHFLSGGDIPLTGQENHKYSQQIFKELKPTDFIQVVDNFIHDHKTIFFDSTSTAFSPDFTREYILKKLSAVDQLKTSPYEFKTPSAVTRLSPNLSQNLAIKTVTVADKKPAKLEKRIPLAENLILLKYKNGFSVILNNTPREYTVIKAIAKENLNIIPKGDREYFKNSLNFIDGGYGNYNSKDINTYETSLGILKKTTLSNNNFEYKVSGLPENFDQIIKIFNLSITDAYKQDEAVFNRKLNSYLKVKAKAENDSTFVENNYLPTISDEKDTTNIDTAAERFFNYNQILKKDLSSSLIYISGTLPKNAVELVSKYIATIPVSKIKPFKTDSTPPSLPSGIIKNEISWKRRGCMVIHLFDRIPTKPLTFKDELILEAIAQYSNIKMLQVIREKYGLVYSTGTTGIIKKEPYELCTLSIRYMIDPLNIEQSSKILQEEVLTPMSTGQITDREVQQLKAILKTTYITSFFDEKQIEEEWLNRNIKYNTVLTPEFIKNTISSITAEDIKKMMKEVVDMKNYHLTIRKYEKNN
ncbi:putative Zn-dependent peptidase [Flavobacterium granuli]|uniref:Zn-dependent peptidase n=2 Tax=Flavobacterium granuli TaxID=280093 RepID=A0A1M5SA56_9FLAO|nr:putative Zn-dependent peptidase [Flavobacterium granuli]SHH34783.1 Predicted Zn-dependent peptidase [Flavobacterium granuli]